MCARLARLGREITTDSPGQPRRFPVVMAQRRAAPLGLWTETGLDGRADAGVEPAAPRGQERLLGHLARNPVTIAGLPRA